jgi:hypothetical protein
MAYFSLCLAHGSHISDVKRYVRVKLDIHSTPLFADGIINRSAVGGGPGPTPN